MSLQSQVQLFKLHDEGLVVPSKSDAQAWASQDRTRFQASFSSCSRGSPPQSPLLLESGDHVLHSVTAVHPDRRVVIVASYTTGRTLMLQIVKLPADAGTAGAAAATASDNLKLQSRVFPWLPDVGKDVVALSLSHDGSVVAACTRDGCLYLLPVLLLMTFERACPFHPLQIKTRLPSLAAIATHKLQSSMGDGPVPSDIHSPGHAQGEDEEDEEAARRDAEEALQDEMLGLPRLKGCAVMVPVMHQLAPTASLTRPGVDSKSKAKGKEDDKSKGKDKGKAKDKDKDNKAKAGQAVIARAPADLPTCCVWWTPAAVAVARELRSAARARLAASPLDSALTSEDDLGQLEDTELEPLESPFQAAEGCYVIVGYASGRVTVVDVSSHARHVAWSALVDSGHPIQEIQLFAALPQLAAAGAWSLPVEYSDPASFQYSEDGQRLAGQGSGPSEEAELAVRQPYPCPLKLPTTSLVIRTTRRYYRMALEKPLGEDEALVERRAAARKLMKGKDKDGQAKGKKTAGKDSGTAAKQAASGKKGGFFGRGSSKDSSVTPEESLTASSSSRPLANGSSSGTGDPSLAVSWDLTDRVEALAARLPPAKWTTTLLDVTGETAVSLMRQAQADGESEAGLGVAALAGIDPTTAAALLQTAAKASEGAGVSITSGGALAALASYATTTAVYSRPGIILYVPIPVPAQGADGAGAGGPGGSAALGSNGAGRGLTREPSRLFQLNPAPQQRQVAAPAPAPPPKRRNSLAAALLGGGDSPAPPQSTAQGQAADPSRLLPPLPATFNSLPLSWRPRPLAQSPARCDIGVVVSPKTSSCLISVFYFASDDKLLLFDPQLGEAPLFELTVATRPSTLRAALARVAYARLRMRLLAPAPSVGTLGIHLVSSQSQAQGQGQEGSIVKAQFQSSSSAREDESLARRIRYGNSRVVQVGNDDEDEQGKTGKGTKGSGAEASTRQGLDDDAIGPCVTINLRACHVVWADGLVFLAENPTAPDLDEVEVAALTGAEDGGDGDDENGDGGEEGPGRSDSVEEPEGEDQGEYDRPEGSLDSQAEAEDQDGAQDQEQLDDDQDGAGQTEDPAAVTLTQSSFDGSASRTGNSNGMTVVVVPPSRSAEPPVVPAPGTAKRPVRPGAQGLLSPGGSASAAMRYGKATRVTGQASAATASVTDRSRELESEPSQQLLPRVSMSSETSWDERGKAGPAQPASISQLQDRSSLPPLTSRARLLVISTNVAIQSYRDQATIDAAVRLTSMGQLMPGRVDTEATGPAGLPSTDSLRLPSDSVLETFELPQGEVVVGLSRVLVPLASVQQAGKEAELGIKPKGKADASSCPVLVLSTTSGSRFLVPHDILAGQALLGRLIDKCGVGWPHAPGSAAAQLASSSLPSIDRLSFSLGLSLTDVAEAMADECARKAGQGLAGSIQGAVPAVSTGTATGPKSGRQTWPETLASAMTAGYGMAVLDGLAQAGHESLSLAYRSLSLFALASAHPLKPLHLMASIGRPDLAVAYAIRALGLSLASAGEEAGLLPSLPPSSMYTGKATLSPNERLRMANLLIQAQLLCPPASACHYGLSHRTFHSFLATCTDYNPQLAVDRCVRAGAVAEACVIAAHRLDKDGKGGKAGSNTSTVHRKDKRAGKGKGGQHVLSHLQRTLAQAVRHHGIGCVVHDPRVLHVLAAIGAAPALLVDDLGGLVPSKDDVTPCLVALREALLLDLPALCHLLLDEQHASCAAVFARVAEGFILPRAATAPADLQDKLWSCLQQGLLDSVHRSALAESSVARQAIAAQLGLDLDGLPEDGEGHSGKGGDLAVLDAVDALSHGHGVQSGLPSVGLGARASTDLYLLLTALRSRQGAGLDQQAWVDLLTAHSGWYRLPVLLKLLTDVAQWKTAALLVECPYLASTTHDSKNGVTMLPSAGEGPQQAHLASTRASVCLDAHALRVQGITARYREGCEASKDGSGQAQAASAAARAAVEASYRCLLLTWGRHDGALTSMDGEAATGLAEAMEKDALLSGLGVHMIRALLVWRATVTGGTTTDPIVTSLSASPFMPLLGPALLQYDEVKGQRVAMPAAQAEALGAGLAAALEAAPLPPQLLLQATLQVLE